MTAADHPKTACILAQTNTIAEPLEAPEKVPERIMMYRAHNDTERLVETDILADREAPDEYARTQKSGIMLWHFPSSGRTRKPPCQRLNFKHSYLETWHAKHSHPKSDTTEHCL